MRILGIDTSTIVATVAVIEKHRLMGEIIINHEKKHSEKILPAIDCLLKSINVSIKDIEGFAVSTGPGSFTGIRIGVATVKGLAQGLDRPVYGVSTLKALAYNMPVNNFIHCPMLDAQRGEVYTGLYQWQKGQCINIMADNAKNLEDLTQILNKQSAPVLLSGDGVYKHAEFLKTQVDIELITAPEHLIMPRASSVAKAGLDMAQKGEAEHFKTLEPVYLRPSYAEEKRK
jgi:tRNA threonylcarbamoyladenosine biosynthesis protein TsaB